MRTTDVDVGPLREAFLRSNLSATDVALAVGWVKPDSNRVTKTLGLTPYHMGYGHKPTLRQRMSYRNAERLGAALGLDPVDWDGGTEA